MATRKITSRGRYSDSWDAFIKKTAQYTKDQRKHMLEEATISGRLSSIVAQAEAANGPARERDRQNRARLALRQQQERIVRESRQRLIHDNLRTYVPTATHAVMPPPALHQTTTHERAEHAAASRQFWGHLRHPSQRRIRRIHRDLNDNYRNYGPPVTAADLAALLAQFPPKPVRPVQVKRIPRGSINPAGMTIERALEIAIASLERT